MDELGDNDLPHFRELAVAGDGSTIEDISQGNAGWADSTKAQNLEPSRPEGVAKTAKIFI